MSFPSLLSRSSTSAPAPPRERDVLGEGLAVPLDGSPFARAALAVAASLARQAGAAVDVVAVVAPGAASAGDEAELASALRRLGDVAGRARVLEGSGPADALVALTGSTPGAAAPLLCMASHGFARLTAAGLSDVTEQVLARRPQPVVVVGPLATAGPVGAPVAVLLDGGPAEPERATTALDIAAALHAPLLAVSIAVGEPAPPRGGSHLAGRLDELARRRGVEVARHVAADPVSSSHAVCAALDRWPAQLLVVGRETDEAGPDPVVQLITRCPVPVLVTSGRPGPAVGPLPAIPPRARVFPWRPSTTSG